MAANSQKSWTARVGFQTDVGRERDRNEDAYYVYLPYPGEESRSFTGGVFAVADGMGGHEAGDVASRHAAAALEEALVSSPARTPETAGEAAATIKDLLHKINDDLLRMGRERGAARGMGCALTAGVLFDSELIVAHVGDTRCYRMRGEKLEQLTEDHSWVAQQRRAGLLSEEEEAEHPRRNVLTQALGMEGGLQVYLRQERVAAGDRYLVCSDGLHGPVDDAMLARVLREERDPQGAAGRLVDLANEGGGSDNITVVVVDLQPATPSPASPAPVAGETLADTVPPRQAPHPPAAQHAGGRRQQAIRWISWTGVTIIAVAAGFTAGQLAEPGMLEGRPPGELERSLHALADGEILRHLAAGRTAEAQDLFQGRVPGAPVDPAARELVRRLGVVPGPAEPVDSSGTADSLSADSLTAPKKSGLEPEEGEAFDG
ncbi:MAG: hypothetical protein GF355_16105 [Candidatus Eisenbacteria bacterium]|nr:hypothetical protein [Candidatus Eisenbacteria bacterium]